MGGREERRRKRERGERREEEEEEEEEEEGLFKANAVNEEEREIRESPMILAGAGVWSCCGVVY